MKEKRWGYTAFGCDSSRRGGVSHRTDRRRIEFVINGKVRETRLFGENLRWKGPFAAVMAKM